MPGTRRTLMPPPVRSFTHAPSIQPYFINWAQSHLSTYHLQTLALEETNPISDLLAKCPADVALERTLLWWWLQARDPAAARSSPEATILQHSKPQPLPTCTMYLTTNLISTLIQIPVSHSVFCETKKLWMSTTKRIYAFVLHRLHQQPQQTASMTNTYHPNFKPLPPSYVPS